MDKTDHGMLAFLALLLTTLSYQPTAAFAQNTVFTYQGQVLDHGTNFTGTGQFKFGLVTSSNANVQATATANPPSGGFITGYAVVNGGSGYVSAPSVTVSGGGGSGASATAHLTGSSVTSLTVVSPGSGYTSTPTVTLSAPPANITYTTYWSNDGTSVAGSQPAAAVSVAVANGLFTVVLGDTSLPNMSAIAISLFAQPNLQVQIWFNDGVNGFAQLSPVQNLTPTPYAVNVTGPVKGGQITGSIATATNFSGSLAGDVTGPQNATVVATVGGQTAATVASGAIAANALLNSFGYYNFFAGSEAGNFTMMSTAQGNTGVGVQSLSSLTSGNSNTGIGNGALRDNTTGAENVGVGGNAGILNTNGNLNTAVGVSALQNNTGSQNTALGNGAGFNLTSGNNNICIGAFVEGVAGESGITRIGGAYTTDTFLSGTIHGNGGANFSGSVGIGTATPANNLSVAGSADFSGNVGIGTTSPTQAKLVVLGFNNTDPNTTTPYGILTPTGAFGGQTPQDTRAVGIYADQVIWSGQWIIASSDERIKHILNHSAGGEDLKTLLGIEITDFTYIDTQSKGAEKHKKVIAQQVEKVFPEAVSRQTDVVPDIYQQAEVKDGWVQLATNLKKGERVRLIGAKKEAIQEVLEVADGKFRTDFAADSDHVFVYGREVKDFRTVDYDAIAMLNVSATQELSRRVEKQAAELAARDAKIAALEKANRDMQRDLASQKELASQMQSEFASLHKAVARLADKSVRTVALNH